MMCIVYYPATTTTKKRIYLETGTKINELDICNLGTKEVNSDLNVSAFEYRYRIMEFVAQELKQKYNEGEDYIEIFM